MRILCCLALCIWLFVMPVSALDIQAPEVPEAGRDFMPVHTDSLEKGLEELLKKAAESFIPDLKEGAGTAAALICAVLMTGILSAASAPVKSAAAMAGTLAVALLLMGTADTMITLGCDTVGQISEYSKLLVGVMAAALAAQGGIAASGALYAGTALFDGVLTGIISRLMVPGIRLYLAVSIANSATGENMLKNMAQLIKGAMTFSLKLLLTVYTAYLGLTGVITGTTDAAALKAAKVTISTVVPVVGGILSDASEAVLVSASLLRSAAGIYGIFAVLSLLLGPFLKIAAHYLILKLSAAVCAVFGEKSMTDLISDFSGAMGLLLGMTGASSLMSLISTVCFLRGVGA